MKQIGIIFLVLISVTSFSATPEEKLKSLGIKLIKPTSSIGNYAHYVKIKNMIYLTGKGPSLAGGGYMIGKLGAKLSIKDGQKASRLTIIHQLGVLKDILGDLSKIKKFVKLTAIVNSTDDFKDHPKVADGGSDLITKVFGDAIGKHARTVYGVNSLPMNIPVEIDLIVEVKETK